MNHIDWFGMLNQLCIHGTNCTCYWYITLSFLYCCVCLDKIWFRLFASLLINDIGLLFSLLIMSILWFGIWVILEPNNNLGGILSDFSISWRSLCQTGIISSFTVWWNSSDQQLKWNGPINSLKDTNYQRSLKKK